MRGWLIVIVAFLAAAGSALAAPIFTNLGVLPGGSASYGNAISSDGSVVVGFSDSSNGGRAFRWTLAEGMQNLGTLPSTVPSGQNPYSGAYTISADGSTVAGYSSLAEGTNLVQRAFRLSIGGSMENLGVLPFGDQSSARALSADGSAVAGYNISDSGSDTAFRWTNAGGIQNLGVLPFGSYSFGAAISADGSVIAGTSNPSGDGDRAFRWTSAGGMQNLGVPPGASHSSARAISADGMIVAGYVSVPGPPRAFRWTSSGGFQDLGTLPGSVSSDAVAISGNGLVVSGTGYASADGAPRAAIWTQSLGLVDLNTMLPMLGIDLTGWALIEASGLSFDGTAIVGYGRLNGQERAWVVTGFPAVPPPCGDVSGDGVVNFVDITSILSTWGTASVFGDANQDGIVNFADITLVLAQWGETCP